MPGSTVAGIILSRKRRGDWPLKPDFSWGAVILAFIILGIVFFLLPR